MHKRLKIIIISCISAALVLGGWTAYAATSSNTTTSTSITGKLVSMTKDTITVHTDGGDQSVPLALSVWVSLNDQKAQLSDLQAGNQMEVILNNKGQAAYVKGSSEALSETTAVSEIVPSNPTLQGDQPAKEAPSSSSTPLPSPTKLKESVPEATRADMAANLEDMDVSVDGQHFNLHIKQNKGAQGQNYDLNIQSPHAGKVHLTGAQAQAWISDLLGSVDLTTAGAQQALKEQLAKQYNLDGNKLNVHLKVNSKNMHEDEDDKVKETEKEKQKAKEKDKEKENDKKHGNSNKQN